MIADAPPCFHESDRSNPLTRRAAAEGVGTSMLVFAASAGGIAATRLWPSQPGASVVLVAVAVPGALVALIIAFGNLSGGHFNPLITLLQLLAGERSLPCSAAYIASQLAGGLAGGLFAAELWHAGPTGAAGLGVGGVASEFVASTGLMLVVFGASRSGRAATGPFAVGAWLAGAILATPTRSYANPAVAIGALATAGPIALSAGSVIPYVGAEIAGALVALGTLSLLYPARQAPR